MNSSSTKRVPRRPPIVPRSAHGTPITQAIGLKTHPSTVWMLAGNQPIKPWIHGFIGWFPANIQTVLGWVFSPIAWVMGVPWADRGTIGGLLGTRLVLDEFIAYAQLGPPQAALEPGAVTIAPLP